MEELKNRKRTRLRGANYDRNGAVFLTICTKERRCVLSRIVGKGIPEEVLSSNVIEEPRVELTKYGQIADKYIRELNEFYNDISVESYVIMPNHIHILLWVKGNEIELSGMPEEIGPSRTRVHTRSVPGDSPSRDVENPPPPLRLFSTNLSKALDF